MLESAFQTAHLRRDSERAELKAHPEGFACLPHDLMSERMACLTFRVAYSKVSSRIMLVPSLDKFLAQAQGRRMPVYRDILADLETPLSAYWKLAHVETYSFLLESVTGGEQLARYSILGVRPRVVVRSKDDVVRNIDSEGNETCHSLKAPSSKLQTSGPDPNTKNPAPNNNSDPLEAIAAELLDPPVHVEGLPKFIGGAVGMLAYDYVRFLERLPEPPVDDLGMDDMAMMLCDTVVVFDHARNLLRIISLAEGTEAGYEQASKEIERIVALLSVPMPKLPNGHAIARSGDQDDIPSARRPSQNGSYTPAHESNMSRADFEISARKAIDYITQGDCIQVVLSQRLSADYDGHPLTLYRALRSLNPSPYMFLLRFGDMDIVGASPELFVSLEGRTGRVRPIAGTRWRGETPEEDERLAKELLADEKEQAEHIMLVDLGRNDLGRVAEYGSVKVNELMVVERYSHVMHIVSDVTGEVGTREGDRAFRSSCSREDKTRTPTLSLPLSGTVIPTRGGGARPPNVQHLRSNAAFDLLRACFPAGTVSGAPKVRAMQAIDELEPTRRGVYGGAIGYFSATGDMDTAIAIRTIVLKDGKAHVQAGAGIVYDSVPEREYEETLNKARASLRAIEMAMEGLE